MRWRDIDIYTRGNGCRKPRKIVPRAERWRTSDKRSDRGHWNFFLYGFASCMNLGFHWGINPPPSICSINILGSPFHSALLPLPPTHVLSPQILATLGCANSPRLTHCHHENQPARRGTAMRSSCARLSNEVRHLSLLSHLATDVFYFCKAQQTMRGFVKHWWRQEGRWRRPSIHHRAIRRKFKQCNFYISSYKRCYFLIFLLFTLINTMRWQIVVLHSSSC